MPVTHQVKNQPQPLENYNAYGADTALQYWVERMGGSWGRERLFAYGDNVGGALLQAGFDANENEPQFISHDRFGERIDLVKYHPSYHWLMASAIDANMHALPWSEPQPGAHVVRAAMEYLHMQADPGSGCPLTMTFAAVPALRHSPELAEQWLPRLFSQTYDRSNQPYFEKSGVTIGMAMTEKQGGSDVRANSTVAKAIGEVDGVPVYALTGHKWFCSAPMSDAFLVLAQAPEGLSCFLLPRWRPDGAKNAMHIQRLKNKLGNRSNASSEVEFDGAFAWLLGEPGRGVRTIIEMVSMTRFDCILGSAALIRGSTAQAIHHCSGREAFGTNLLDQPLMQNVLADLALESEASLALGMRLAKALDHSDNEHEQSLARIGTAIGKYWVCKRAPQATYEAMESVGGVGYIEDNLCARNYREAPVNAIWEGSGNIQCLDVLRALQKQPQTLQAIVAECERATGASAQFDYQLRSLKNATSGELDEYYSRRWVEQCALLLQASTLVQYAEPWIAEAFIKNRLTSERRWQFGTLLPGTDCEALIARGRPKV